MFRGSVQIQTSVGLLPLSHLCANLPDCHNVMDLILDQTRGRPRQGHIRGHQPADPFNPARQQPEVITTGFLHQSHR